MFSMCCLFADMTAIFTLDAFFFDIVDANHVLYLITQTFGRHAHGRIRDAYTTHRNHQPEHRLVADGLAVFAFIIATLDAGLDEADAVRSCWANRTI